MTYANGTSQVQVEHFGAQAVVCRKCDRAMVGGTLPARLSLCGSCAINDSRPRVTRYQKRKAWQRKRDRILDKYLSPALMAVGSVITVASICYWLSRALGLVQ